MRFFFVFALLSSYLTAFYFDISDVNILNGKTSLIEFKKEKNTKYEKIIFEQKSFKIYNHPFDDNKLYALLPISYYQKPDNKMVEVHYKQNGVEKSRLISVKIQAGDYKKEQLQVTKSKVNPDKKYKKRIDKEYKEAMDVYNSATKKTFIKSNFILPMDSFITSGFGKARVYNNTLKGYHGGTDFRAKVGTPVIASNDGVVALSKDRFYSGGTVVIDHGQGIYTCYFHMSKLNVKKSQKVKKGDIIGLSGQSGRVSGPHLHFGIRVGGVQVDPLQFVELVNKKLLKETKQ